MGLLADVVPVPFTRAPHHEGRASGVPESSSGCLRKEVWQALKGRFTPTDAGGPDTDPPAPSGPGHPRLMRLARSASDDPLEWFLYLGVVVVYALGRWFFAWRQARRDGQIHPLRAVLAEDDDSETMRRTPYGGFSSYRQFFGFVGSAAAVALVASLTHGRLRVSLMWTIVPLLTLALAYLDFRLSRKARDRRGERRKAPHQIRISIYRS
ncbi:hypothetical protein ACWC9H_31355 [Streptomyces sp. NPDC001251]